MVTRRAGGAASRVRFSPPRHNNLLHEINVDPRQSIITILHGTFVIISEIQAINNSCLDCLG